MMVKMTKIDGVVYFDGAREIMGTYCSEDIVCAVANAMGVVGPERIKAYVGRAKKIKEEANWWELSRALPRLRRRVKLARMVGSLYPCVMGVEVFEAVCQAIAFVVARHNGFFLVDLSRFTEKRQLLITIGLYPATYVERNIVSHSYPLTAMTEVQLKAIADKLFMS